MSSQPPQVPLRRAPVTATALLTVLSLALWFLVAQELLYSVPPLERLCRDLEMALPNSALQVFAASRWFGGYWWVVALGMVFLLPVVVLLTYWVHQQQRWPLLRWVWGALLIVPPLVLFEVVWLDLSYTSQVAVKGLEEAQRRDSVLDYLTPTNQLRGPLKITEQRDEDGRPGGEVLVIEPTGEWRITSLNAGEQPLRQGKLTRGQLALLARHLAVQFSRLPFQPLSAEWSNHPHDLLRIEFAGDEATCLGVSRRTLREAAPPANPEEASAWARFVALVLVVDDLVGQGQPR